MKEVVFVVDDEESIREYLSILLAKEGYVVRTFSNGEDALDALSEHSPAVVLLDIKMPGLDGIAVLERIKRFNRNIQVIMMTAFGTIKSAVEAMKKGAFHYITKPFDSQELRLQITKALEFWRLTSENIRLKKELKTTFRKLVGKSPKFLHVLDLIDKVAPTDATVLILGESGTGKELVARAIHEHSPRSSYPFVAINCAALPEDLLESELFGYVKGAFTGAVTDKEGLFKTAHKGTIFLDEVGDISLKLQVKLLRVLQEREFTPLGSTKPQRVDVRVIASSNRDLDDMVREGKFREDLYYRLNVISLQLPPLRERRDDIPLLVGHFINQFSKKNGIPPKRPTKEVMEVFMKYDWPGNVRELENAIERALILSPGEEIILESLPPALWRPKEKGEERFPSPTLTLEELEKKYILKVLEATKWDKAKAARILGVNVSTVYRKLSRYGIRVESESAKRPLQNAKGLKSRLSGQSID